MIWIYLSESLLYLCFSIMMGVFIIQFIPERFKPDIQVSKRVVQLAILGVVLFSVAPVIRIILFLYEDIGLIMTIQNVLGGFEVGKAWNFTVILSIFFYLFVSIFPVLKKRLLSAISLVFTLALIVALGWASHSASLTVYSGFIFHTLHFLAVTVWIGILLTVGWFSKNQNNWLRFLQWYTPVAASCFLIIAGSGIYMMTLVIDVNEYMDAWMVSYGQALLMKHLSIIPVLFFAFMNGFWMKRKLRRQEPINPLPWLKLESVLLFITFVLTGILGQQEPPHSIKITLSGNGPSPIFDYFYSGIIEPAMHLEFGYSTISILFLTAAVWFLSMIVYCFRKGTSAAATFLMGLFCAISIYFGLMSSIGS